MPQETPAAPAQATPTPATPPQPAAAPASGGVPPAAPATPPTASDAKPATPPASGDAPAAPKRKSLLADDPAAPDSSAAGSQAAPAQDDVPVPEGVDPDWFKGTAKELGLDKAKAEALGKQLKAAEAKKAEAVNARLEAQRGEWQKTIQSKPGWEEDVKHAKVALKKFAPKELYDALADYERPEFVAFLAAVGRATAASGPLPPGTTAPPPKPVDPMKALAASLEKQLKEKKG